VEYELDERDDGEDAGCEAEDDKDEKSELDARVDDDPRIVLE
jgi:hypothetical protein